MFERIGRLAERAANGVSVSRRGFLGRLGRGAMAVGALLAGFSAAAGQSGGVVCCFYMCSRKPHYAYSWKTKCQNAGTTCAPVLNNCSLWSQGTATDCNSCTK
jgi:hypothetical protein